MRDGSAAAQEALSRQAAIRPCATTCASKRCVSARAQLRAGWCATTPSRPSATAARADTIARLEADLERIDTARARIARHAKTKRRSAQEAAHTKAECALRDHPSLGRYLRQTAAGRLRIDRAKVKAEERLDGKFLLSTSDPDLTPEDVALAYKNLLEAERGFRDLKSTLELRPVFHCLEHRIRAHVLLCWLALLLIRVTERATGQTWRTVNRELARLHEVTLTGDAGTVAHTTELTDARPPLGELDR